MSKSGTLRRWTPEEDEVIRAAWMRRRIGDVADELGRRLSEVSTRACRIGVRPAGTRWRATPEYATERGRRVVGYAPNRRGKATRVLEHRVIAEGKIGRPLTTTDVVHHVDLDPTNNTPANLDVLTGPAAHLRAHRSLDALVAPLMRAGVITYDWDNGTYRMVGE